MLSRSVPALLACCLTIAPLRAQDWDPVKHASGWARFDKDGSCMFFDAGAKRLVPWSRDDQALSPVDLSRLDGPPEFWAMDPMGNAWVATGTTLQQVEKSGKLGTRIKLPASVADLAWDARGIVISYRAPEPYVEKRDYKGGGLIWSFGNRPEGRSSGPALFRVEVSDAGDVFLTRGGSMVLDQLDGQKGKAMGAIVPVLAGGTTPELSTGSADRLPLAAWIGHQVLFAAVPGTQAHQAGLNGLLLARIDLGRKTLEFLPTGLTEDFTFAGIFEDQGAFISPKGGLAFAPIH